MFYGKVIGTVVATQKDQRLSGHKLLVVQKIDYEGGIEGEPIIAVDYVQAGVGDIVFLAKSKDSVFPLKERNAPIDAGIVGIIDYIRAVDEKQEK
ncbi:MAG TPA: EutN/CcmL family microcompartment protein [Clostridia bacterium]|nr:EutN/CcmL family microcompartment protein [Clostridia bacterium]